MSVSSLWQDYAITLVVQLRIVVQMVIIGHLRSIVKQADGLCTSTIHTCDLVTLFVLLTLPFVVLPMGVGITVAFIVLLFITFILLSEI